jgi:uroporphyrinogen decarboxylase
VRTLDDLKTIAWQPATREAIREEWIRHYRSVQAGFAPHTMFVPGGGCGFHATYGLMGLQLFCYALADAPAEIERIMELHLADAVARAEVAAGAKLCPLYFIGDDIAYKGKLMFSPDYLRRSFIRCLRSCCEPLKAAGIKVIFHSDGNVMEILDDMLDAGIDGLNPLEPIAGMDIGYLKRRYGKRLILVGGVDCSQVLPLGTVEEVVAAAKHVLRTAGPGGGLFIGSSSEVTPSTPLENILAFYETARTAGRYPIRC